MYNSLEIDLILNKKNYSKTYNIGLIIVAILLVFIYVIFTYKYQSYYIAKGKIIDNQLELLTNINDIEYIKNNTKLTIDNKIYSYKITTISNDILVDENYNNYRYIYLKIDNISNIDNFVYEIKIPKENKILAKYLKDYL